MTTTNLLTWLANGKRGISSNTIATHLTGIDCLGDWRPDHPYDTADLSRCRKLLEQVPELKPLFPNMATCSATWARLAMHWQELCDLMDAEAPRWADGEGDAPKTYARMRDLIEGRRKEQRT